jgi:peptidyl-prolyl cis-trans isomerase SDCCAG10
MFNRRGLLGMANAEKNDNSSQFFFTLAATPELNKKHTLFGKISDNTIFNMIKINESECIDERPKRPVTIYSTQVIYNPFEDIVPRNLRANEQPIESKKQVDDKKGVKNFGLLSFGDEAEDQEEELETLSVKFKSKSAHDINDPYLISKEESESESEYESESESDEPKRKKLQKRKDLNTNEYEAKSVDLDNIRSKLSKRSVNDNDDKPNGKESANAQSLVKMDEKQLKMYVKKTQDEIKRLEKELSSDQKSRLVQEKANAEKEKEQKVDTEVVLKYKEEIDKYEHLKKQTTKKTAKSAKEEKTLELLAAFRDRLFKAKEQSSNDQDPSEQLDKSLSEQTVDPLDSILKHRLELTEEIKQKVIDANLADNDRYDIYDPRNPLNKRKLEESKKAAKERKSGQASSSKQHYN